MDIIYFLILNLIILVLTLIFIIFFKPKVISFMSNVIYNLKMLYRLTRGIERQESILWQELKAFHKKINPDYLIHGTLKCIESYVETHKDFYLKYRYLIHDGKFICSVKHSFYFPDDVTIDIFILATHLNNILNGGIVKVNVENKYIEYTIEENVIVPLLKKEYLKIQIINHFNNSKLVQWAYDKLIVEREEPVLIIAELMRKNESEELK